MKRSTLYLTGAFLVLGLLTYFVMQRPGEQSTTGTLGQALVDYDSTAVDRLDISSSSGSVSLTREGGRWMLTSPIRYHADEGAVAAAVGKGRTIELKSLVSSNPQKQSLFQVDSAGTVVRVFERGTEKAVFRIGKTSPSFTETYVRREGSDDVYLAEGMFSYTFVRQVRDWRDKTIFKAQKDSMSTVAFAYGDTTFTLARPDTMWLVNGMPATESAVQPLLSSLANLQADEFVDSTVTTMKKPAAIITVGGTQIAFYWNKDRNLYYVVTSLSPQIFEVQTWRAEQVLKRTKDLLPPAK